MPAVDGRARAAVRRLETTYQPGLPIEEVRRRFRLTSVVKLASNENALGPSPKALAGLRRAVAGLNRYPDKDCTLLRQKLSKTLGVGPASLIVGNGSDELLVLALRAFVEPGEEVLVAEPTFLIYALQARACGAAVRAVPLRDDRYDLPAMAAAVSSRTKLIFIANPDNPTGTYVTRRELEAFFQDLPRHTLVLIDEAYYEFVAASDYPQTLAYVGRYPVIVTRSFSKAYGLAGLRVGYGIAEPPVVAAMEAVREPFNVNSLAQAAAAAALEDRAYVARTRRLLEESRRYLTRELDALGIRYVPSVTNFLLLKVGPRAPALAQALLRRGIIVREMSAWKLPGCLRVTFGTMPENRAFVTALKGCLRSGGRG
jgi:histidinol-phosphate aminotransferase